MVGAGIGLAVPAQGEQYGYISEHHDFGITEARMRDLVEDMAATMLATTLGIEFDPETAYDKRKEIYHMSGKIIKRGPASKPPRATRTACGPRSSPRQSSSSKARLRRQHDLASQGAGLVQRVGFLKAVGG